MVGTRLTDFGGSCSTMEVGHFTSMALETPSKHPVRATSETPAQWRVTLRQKDPQYKVEKETHRQALNDVFVAVKASFLKFKTVPMEVKEAPE